MRRSQAEVKQIQKEARHLRSLLKEFGLTLAGWNPGVLAWQPTGRFNDYGKPTSTSLTFDRREWAFIEPLLIELRALRRKAKKNEPT